MGAGTFFSKIASYDPIAQALHLPGASSYVNYEQAKADEAQPGAHSGPYQGVSPTLAAAQAGYAAGGPGSNSQWRPYTAAPNVANFFQRAASAPAAGTPATNPWGGGSISPVSGINAAASQVGGIAGGNLTPQYYRSGSALEGATGNGGLSGVSY